MEVWHIILIIFGTLVLLFVLARYIQIEIRARIRARSGSDLESDPDDRNKVYDDMLQYHRVVTPMMEKVERFVRPDVHPVVRRNALKLLRRQAMQKYRRLSNVNKVELETAFKNLAKESEGVIKPTHGLGRGFRFEGYGGYDDTAFDAKIVP